MNTQDISLPESENGDPLQTELEEEELEKPGVQEIIDLTENHNDEKPSPTEIRENSDITIKTKVGAVKPQYKHVEYVHCVSGMAVADLDPSDETTVTIFFDTESKKLLYYYKGHTYKYGTGKQLRLCSKSQLCSAALILRQESSQLLETGTHTCNGIKKSRKNKTPSIKKKIRQKHVLKRLCPPLRPLVSKKSSEANFHKKCNNVKLVCLKNGATAAELDPNDSTKIFVYQNEAGIPIFYYKGYTYVKNHLIYLCSKSRGCSAALVFENKCRLTELGKHNCTLTSGSNCIISHEPECVNFKVCAVKEFGEVPGFDPNDNTTVTMLLSDGHRHNIVFYKGHTYVDDRSISCERGGRLTKKSCNLLYMCVKSNVCSAGLFSNRDRTTVLEVGLHNCLITDGTDDYSKLFRELKLVTFEHSLYGKSDINNSVKSAEVVTTYYEKGKKVASYNGYTYGNRLAACSHSVGCKCLYVCNKRSDCSAAIMVHSRQAVLEVGLHSCLTVPTRKSDATTITRLPTPFSTPLLNSFGYDIKLNNLSDNTTLPQTSKQRRKNSDEDLQKNKKRKKEKTKRVKHRTAIPKQENDVLFEEQVSFSKNKTLSTKAHQLFTGVIEKQVWNPSLIPVVDEKEKLCVVYRGYLYYFTFSLKQSTSVESKWTCIKPSCVGALHLDGDQVAFTSRHFCTPYILECNESFVQTFYGEKKYLFHAGYIYNWGLSLMNCMYSGCDGVLMIKDGIPMYSEHSCKELNPREEDSGGKETVDLTQSDDDIEIKEEVLEEIDETESNSPPSVGCTSISEEAVEEIDNAIKEEIVEQSCMEGNSRTVLVDMSDLVPFTDNDKKTEEFELFFEETKTEETDDSESSESVDDLDMQSDSPPDSPNSEQEGLPIEDIEDLIPVTLVLNTRKP